VRSANGQRVAVAADRNADAGVSIERAAAAKMRADLWIRCFQKRDLPDRRRRRLRPKMNGGDRGREK
jgi:hypothetical protein